MAYTNAQIAQKLNLLADLYELHGANRFKVIAFQRAARSMENLAQSVADMPRESLSDVDGIGGGMAERIAELLDTGSIAELDELLEQTPGGVIDMLDVPGLGPKTAALIWREGGVTDMAGLKAALSSGDLLSLKGFGKKKAEKLLHDIRYAEQAGQRHRIGTAMELAESFIEHLRGLKSVKRVEYAGSLRRGRESIGDVDILVAAEPQQAANIAGSFVSHEAVSDVIARGEKKSSVRTRGGIQVDLRIVAEAAFGAALMYFTGSKEHNVSLRERAIERGLRLNEYGLWAPGEKADAPPQDDPGARPVASASEEAVYKALGLAWIPPELREDRGEIALAEVDGRGDGKGHGLPELIDLGNIRADLHTHTNASDGTWSIEANARAMAEAGYHTVAITDHSRSQVQANGLSTDRLERHIEAVREVAGRLKGTITVLAGSEVDILKDGGLDYPDELLAELDVVVASPHAALSQDPATCTKRLIRAIENPYVTIIGHATGRLVGRREGLSPDIEAVCGAAAQRGVAMEINANHYRLDLRDTHARVALDCGCKLAINTDAHGPADMGMLRYGVLTARRAGATADDVVNCLSATALRRWIKGTRA